MFRMLPRTSLSLAGVWSKRHEWSWGAVVGGSNPACHRNERAWHGSRQRYKHEYVRMPLWYSLYLSFLVCSALCIVAQLPRGPALLLCVWCSVLLFQPMSRAQSYSCPVSRCARRLCHRVSATCRPALGTEVRGEDFQVKKKTSSPSLLRTWKPRKKNLNWSNWRFVTKTLEKIIPPRVSVFSLVLFHEKWNEFQSLIAPHSWVTVPWPWPTSGLRSIVAVHVDKTKQKKSNLSRDQPPQTEQFNMWSKKKSESRPKYLGEAVRNLKETLRSRHVIKAENSGEDLSNNHDWTPRILHNQLRVTLTHTPALRIYYERIYQDLKREKEKERHTHTTDSKIEEKQERKRKNPEETML